MQFHRRMLREKIELRLAGLEELPSALEFVTSLVSLAQGNWSLLTGERAAKAVDSKCGRTRVEVIAVRVTCPADLWKVFLEIRRLDRPAGVSHQQLAR